MGTGEEVAIKLESVRSRHPQLLFEAKVIRHLKGGVGIPQVRWYGVEGEYNVMVLDLLGPSLQGAAATPPALPRLPDPPAIPPRAVDPPAESGRRRQTS